MLPSNFDLENLVVLNLPYGKVEQLWEGRKEAFKLKSIDLSHSKYLSRIPDPSETPHLERINLESSNLPSIPLYIQNFKNLGLLHLRGLKSLMCFPPNLRFSSVIEIDLSHCTNLIQFPQILGNIVKLNLSSTAIEEVPSSIESLPRLETLYLNRCKRLKSISTSICKLKSLYRLDLFKCSNLESFPEILEEMECLEELYMGYTAVKELPSSIEHLEGLERLDLRNCSKLDSLPENLGNLKSLKYVFAEKWGLSQLPSSIADLKEIRQLSFSGCRGMVLPPLSGLSSLVNLDLSDCDMKDFPEHICCISSLETLHLRGNKFESLPTSIKQLSRRGSLDLRDCNMLQSLPQLPLFLTFLDATNCKQLQFLPELPSYLEELDPSALQSIAPLSPWDTREFIFVNCHKLNEKANNIVEDLQLRIQHMAIEQLKLLHFYREEIDIGGGFSIFLPGSVIPDWFSCQCSGSSITIHLPQHLYRRHFIGFSLCAVIRFEEDAYANGKDFIIKCSYCFETKTLSESKHVFLLSDSVSIDSDHVCFGFDSCCDIRLPNGDHDTVVSFEFFLQYNDPITREGKVLEVKHCGVCLVYAYPSKTKPNSFSLKFATISEEECPDIRNLHDEASMIGINGSIGRSDEEKVEAIFTDQINSTEQESSFFSQIFYRRDGLFAFLIRCLPGCG